MTLGVSLGNCRLRSALYHGLPKAAKEFRIEAPTARNVIAWASGPGSLSLKDRERCRRGMRYTPCPA